MSAELDLWDLSNRQPEAREELLRLRRIEEAARWFISWLDGEGSVRDDRLDALRAALLGEESR